MEGGLLEGRKTQCLAPNRYSVIFQFTIRNTYLVFIPLLAQSNYDFLGDKSTRNIFCSLTCCFCFSISFLLIGVQLLYNNVLLLLLSHFIRVRLCATHRQQPTRLHHPWDSPGKNAGVGCHFLLQCMEVKSESEVAQSCLTLCNPRDCSPPGSSIHGIFQARVLEWVAIASPQ